ncbi:MAG: XdhC family protein [Gemmatimonadetes bacterium]|nr:XdhC family protein [Gemmatimonadota bacterium]
MKEIVEEIIGAIEAKRPAALVTPVATAGSIPTGRQARMLVFADGSIAGTVGGGRMEGEAKETALAVIEEGEARLIHFALTAQAALEDGLLCGGQATFFVERLSSAQAGHFSRMRELLERGEQGVEAVRLSEGGEVKRLVARTDGDTVGTLGKKAIDDAVLEQLEEVIEEDCARVEEVDCEGEQVEVFVQALQPRPTVFLFGGGHVGLALARLVPTAGMRLVVVDDRAEFCSRERFPMADEVHVREFATALEGLDIGSLGYVVVMTRGHKWDREVVAQGLRTPAGYVGMIGSRRKIGLTWEALKEEGFTDVDLGRVHAPIGLDIGGDTPGEIAISIMAELIQVRRSGGGA